MRAVSVITFLGIVTSVASQQIWDIWQTTWDRSKLFTYFQPNPDPINFVSPGPIGSADISVNDAAVYQTMYGFGASLTDSSALLLNNLKNQNPSGYWQLIDYLFNSKYSHSSIPSQFLTPISVTDASNSAGFSYIRVPLGASDFSASVYSYDDTNGDVNLYSFNIGAAPSYLFSTLTDILSIQPGLRVHVLPWSPPGWMKSGTMNGGSLNTAYTDVMANYLLKSLQGFASQGVPVYAISIQNEPENSNPTYPTCSMPVSTEAQIGISLRSLMDSNGFGNTKIIGYDHNWNDAANYPVQLMQQAGSAFDGVSFHCYSGSYTNQAQFTSQYPSKEVFFTECSGTIGSDWWSDIKWYMNNLFIGSVNYQSSTGLMWNLALDGNGQPLLPGTNSCGGPGCRGVVQINSGGTWSVNQEFYAMAQASKAILPRDVGGPWGQRIGVSVGGNLAWALVASAFVTKRVNPSDWNRYSIVVLNWDDGQPSTWNPQPVTATIEFRGMQATYTFPVGVTTLWWYAPN